MKHDDKSRHRYEVHATRRVRAPQYGPTAHYLSAYEEVFPFGKGEKYATGSAARLAALDRVIDISPQASDVALIKCNGYGGLGEFMKQGDELFDGPWPGEAA